MACLRAALFVVIVAPALAAQVSAPATGAGPDAPALFATNCAKCHGLDGSGTGPAVLDRPARNFKEGGFSFGNTPETIARTIAHGIPGSPMPSFESALSEEQRRALAAYVITLGPPVKEVSEAEELLHVTDRPVIARGILPPLTEGGPLIPRGLLIGTTDGLTFEYAADDVRLLAVRLGDFVKRTDWGGRGGTPIEPLGKVVWSAPQDPSSQGWFEGRKSQRAIDWIDWEVGGRLESRLLATDVSPAPVVSYALVMRDREGSVVRLRGTVIETLGSARLGSHSGFARHLQVSSPSQSPNDATGYPLVALKLGACCDVPGLETPPYLDENQGPTEQWSYRPLGPDTAEVAHVRVHSTSRSTSVRIRDAGSMYLDLGSDADGSIDIDVDTFVLSPWNNEVVAAFRAEVLAR